MNYARISPTTFGGVPTFSWRFPNIFCRIESTTLDFGAGSNVSLFFASEY